MYRTTNPYREGQRQNGNHFRSRLRWLWLALFRHAGARENKSDGDEMMLGTDSLRRIAKTLAAGLSVTREDGKVTSALLASIADGSGPASTQALTYIAALAIYAREREDELERVMKAGAGWKPIHTAPEKVIIIVAVFGRQFPAEFEATEAYREGDTWYDVTGSPGIDFEPTHWIEKAG